MDLLPIAMQLSTQAVRREAGSALPDAPVAEPETRRGLRHGARRGTRPHTSGRPVRAARARTALAHGLERAAAAIAPPATCTPAH